jgi:hypothetical protein
MPNLSSFNSRDEYNAWYRARRRKDNPPKKKPGWIFVDEQITLYEKVEVLVPDFVAEAVDKANWQYNISHHIEELHIPELHPDERIYWDYLMQEEQDQLHEELRKLKRKPC